MNPSLPTVKAEFHILQMICVANSSPFNIFSTSNETPPYKITLQINIQMCGGQGKLQEAFATGSARKIMKIFEDLTFLI